MPDRDYDGHHTGGGPGADPWQELPSYHEGAPGAYGSSWEEPPPPPVASRGPQVPIEQLGAWLEGAWAVLTAGFYEFVVMQLLVIGLTVVSLGTLTGPLTAGYFRYALRRSRGEPADYNDIFSGLSSTFKATFVVGLGLAWGVLASMCVLAALDVIASQFPVAVVALVLRAAVDLTGMVAISTGLGIFVLMLPLIHEQGHTLESAFEVCRSMLRANWVRATLFGVVVGGAPLLGLLLFGIGVLAGGPLGILVGAFGFRALFSAGQEGAAASGPQR